MTEEPQKEFIFLGMNMRDISINYGGILILWAMIVSILSNSQSVTTWIPAMLGIPIFLLGFLSKWYPSKQKLFMHIVVIFGLLCFLGGLDFLRSLVPGSDPFGNIYVGSSKLMLLLTGFGFSLLCIQSFRYIRKLKS